ncbi:MAG: glycosyl hydrolase 53 family protein [Reichenbachiella sp.]
MIRYYFIITCLLVLTSGLATGQDFYFGADLSYVNEMDDCGAVYYEDGEAKDAYDIFNDHGANLIRLRLWQNPDSTNGYSFFEDAKRSIKRAKDRGQSVLLDFHYSDIWADPARQWRPLAWNDITDNEVLADSIYHYTFNTLEALHEEGLLPEMVQVGNETNGNICITVDTDDLRESSPGVSPIDWTRQALLFNHGFEAVNDFNSQYSQTVKKLVHVAQPENTIGWFNSAENAGLIDFDIIGMSYYPKWSDLDIRATADVVGSLKTTFGKDVMIVETDYAWSGTESLLSTRPKSHSKAGQRDYMIELTYLVKQAGGSGVIYWEPAWVDTNCQTLWGTGSSHTSKLHFNYDNELHEGIEWMQYDYSQKPAALEEHEAVFRVDMTGQDISNGVYVSGTFTGDPWVFEEMTLVSDDIYEYKTTVEGRTEGEFLFYTNSDWSSESAEKVDENCADDFRYYVVMDERVEYAYAWGRCDQNPDEPLAAISDKRVINVYPNPVQLTLNFDLNEIVELNIYSITGELLLEKKMSNINAIDVSSLKMGVYTIKVGLSDGTVLTQKIFKQ